MRRIALISLLAAVVLLGCGKKVHKIEGVTLHWYPLTQVQKTFPAAPKPMFLYIRETGCDHCERMDSLIFSRPEVADYLNRYFTPVKIDLSTDMPVTIRDSTLDETQLRKLLSIAGIPAYYFFDPRGQVIGALYSEMDLLQFKRTLVFIRNGHFMRRTPWDEFLKLPEAQLDTVWGVF